MNKQEWISNKIGILIREGRPKDQAVAIAYSMYERGDHMQEGGLPTAQQGLYFANGQDLYGNMVQNAQNMQQPPGYTGVPSTSYPAAPQPLNQQDYNKSKGYDPNMGYTGYVQGDANLSGKVDAKDKVDKFGQPTEGGQPSAQYDDYIKYNILNPYNQGMDLSTSVAYTGQQFGQGHTGQGVMGAGLSLLKGARSFLSGYGAGKGQQDLEKQMKDKLYNNDEKLYNRDVTTYQGGGQTEEDQPLFDIQPQTQSPEWLTSGARMPVAPNTVQPDLTGAVQAGTEALSSAQDTAKTAVEDKNFDVASARDTWEKKTGMPWSEAKRLGYTDGTAKDNTKLLGELNDPRFKKEALRTRPFTAPVAQGQAQHAEVKKVAAVQDYFNSPAFKSLPKAKKEQAQIKAVENLGGWDAFSNMVNRVGEVLANPGQAFAHYAKYNEAIPQNFSKNSTNPIDDTIGILNPFNWVNHAGNAATFAEAGDYGKAAKEALGALPALSKLKYVKYVPIPKGLPAAQAAKAAGYLEQGVQRLPQAAQTLLHQQGGIHIDESHKGLFTEQAHRAGYDNVQAFAHHVMSNKDSFDPATVKRANFAVNAAGWNKQQGGYTAGQEYDLSDEEIQNLIAQGYKIRYK